MKEVLDVQLMDANLIKDCISVNGVFFLHDETAKERLLPIIQQRLKENSTINLPKMVEELLEKEEDPIELAHILWITGRAIIFGCDNIRVGMMRSLISSRSSSVIGATREEIKTFHEEMMKNAPEKENDPNFTAAFTIIICSMLNTAVGTMNHSLDEMLGDLRSQR